MATSAKPKTVQVRISRKIYNRVAQMANDGRRSPSMQLELLIESALGKPELEVRDGRA